MDLDSVCDSTARLYGTVLTTLPHTSCHEVGFFQEGAPQGHPTLVTRLVQPPYDERQCVYMFEDEYKDLGHLPVPNVDATNKAYDGWFMNTTSLFFANAHRASVSLATAASSRAAKTY